MGDPVLDDPGASVHRGASPCADAGPGCGDRVLVSVGEVEVPPQAPTRLAHGEVVVRPAGESYRIADRAEVHAKTDRSPRAGPPETILAETSRRLHLGDGCFLFEDRLEPGDPSWVRPSHAARVAPVLGVTRPQQWPDGADEVFETQIPGTIDCHPPVIHLGKTIGAAPPRNLNLEFIPWGIP